MKGLLAGLASALMLSACATISAAPVSRENFAREIADNAAAFNDAYGQAVSAQILLNILRSRDRMPRYYLAMTGISDSPSYRTLQSAGVGSLPLGGGGTPIGVGSIGIEHERESRPAYAVQPFSAETLTRTAFEPTPPYVFAHYWRSGWPRDILLLVMVEQIDVVSASGAHHVYTNEANTIFNNCADSIDTGGCAFVRRARAFLHDIDGDTAPLGAHGRRVCGLIEAHNPIRPVRAGADGAHCEPAFAVGSDVIRLRLRSLDDMVYYIGELMRAGGMRAAPGAPIEAQVSVLAAGLRGGGAGVPLFRIVPSSGARHRGPYAAEAEYGGVRFAAGPAIGRSCGEAQPAGVCADTAEAGDRSSSVLSLIAEILALNQSPDAIRAPERLLSN